MNPFARRAHVSDFPGLAQGIEAFQRFLLPSTDITEARRLGISLEDYRAYKADMEEIERQQITSDNLAAFEERQLAEARQSEQEHPSHE